MEWALLFWLLIINGALGGQYILNWMGNQKEFVGDRAVGVSPGVMTWWRELSKFLWAFIAVIVEIAKGKELRYFWPGVASMITIMICAFTGVIENIGFFYLPRYYSPHIYAPYVNVYLAFLPFFGKFMFNAPIRKEHWLGIALVVIGLATPHLPKLIGGSTDPHSVMDFNGIIWIIIINCCLCSQQVLNNKTVQTALKGVGPNALVMWREVWKMVFITAALIIFPLMASYMNTFVPEKVEKDVYHKNIIAKLDTNKQVILNNYYVETQNEFVMKQNLSAADKATIKEIVSTTDYHRFFSLFEGSIIPNNWWPILFVVAAGLTGYIYSFGFFKLSKYAAHFWVPYTNVYLALLPFIMMLFGKDVTGYQIAGAVVVTIGLMIGVSDYSRNKVVEIEKKN